MQANDKELLELAAKAAQLDFVPQFTNEWTVIPGVKYGAWNPLRDDGDALRLAVKLGITVDQDAHGVEARRGELYCVELFQDRLLPLDVLCESTRRAIVRTAAEIGKAMP